MRKFPIALSRWDRLRCHLSSNGLVVHMAVGRSSERQLSDKPTYPDLNQRPGEGLSFSLANSSSSFCSYL